MAKAGTGKLMTRHRYGIGEWYGRSLAHLTVEERKRFGRIQEATEAPTEKPLCPFRGSPHEKIPCTKKGGVCSIRLYEQQGGAGAVSSAPGQSGSLVTTCPYRFEQEGTVLKWVGETLLSHPQPQVAEQVGFLQQAEGNQTQKEPASGSRFVGRIDKVLVHPTREPMNWCALEIQEVYCSGDKLAKEFDKLRRIPSERLPFPATDHKPDFLSSAMTLIPRLHIWVRRLQRSGKKTGVVVDRCFFDALGRMGDARDVSNCDVAWFVVKFEDAQGQLRLTPDFVRFTTLGQAIEGLTGTDAVTLEALESRVQQQLIHARSRSVVR